MHFYSEAIFYFFFDFQHQIIYAFLASFFTLKKAMCAINKNALVPFETDVCILIASHYPWPSYMIELEVYFASSALWRVVKQLSQMHYRHPSPLVSATAGD